MLEVAESSLFYKKSTFETKLLKSFLVYTLKRGGLIFKLLCFLQKNPA